MLGHLVTPCLVFEELPNSFPKLLYHFTIPTDMYEDSSFSTSSPKLSVYHFDFRYPCDCEVYHIMFFICIFLMTNGVEHLVMCLLAIVISSLQKCLFKSLAHFVVLLLNLKSSFYILNINSLPNIWFENIFPYSVGCFHFDFFDCVL